MLDDTGPGWKYDLIVSKWYDLIYILYNYMKPT